MWQHLERLGGGIGTRGPGESQLETDRRLARDRVSLLKRQLDVVEKEREVQRQARADQFRVAIVGYTNAGKSTLFNALTRAAVRAEDRLFATLDATTRRIVNENRELLLITDTVGFIRKLPHHLVASFRSTLAEVVEADLWLHVVDASDPDFRRAAGERRGGAGDVRRDRRGRGTADGDRVQQDRRRRRGAALRAADRVPGLGAGLGAHGRGAARAARAAVAGTQGAAGRGGREGRGAARRQRRNTARTVPRSDGVATSMK